MTDNNEDLVVDYIERLEELKRLPPSKQGEAIEAEIANMSPQQRAHFAKLMHQEREELNLDKEMLAYMKWEDADA